MLEDVEKNGNQNVVSWVGSGKAFKVHDLKSFVSKLIPLYFKQSKFKSFQCQLYAYDFKLVSSGPDTGSYYHPKFVRGIKTLCLSTTPKGIKQSKLQKEKIIQNESRAQEPCTAEDPSDWMTKMQSLLVRRGAGLSTENEISKKSNRTENTLCEGDVAFVFGGMPFHFVEATISV